MCCVKCKGSGYPRIWESTETPGINSSGVEGWLYFSQQYVLEHRSYMLLFSYGHNSYIQRNDVM